jgi:hypothetical protein
VLTDPRVSDASTLYATVKYGAVTVTPGGLDRAQEWEMDVTTHEHREWIVESSHSRRGTLDAGAKTPCPPRDARTPHPSNRSFLQNFLGQPPHVARH